MGTELAKFGVTCRGSEDGIEIDGIKYSDLQEPHGSVHCYDDHRVAMSLSVLALITPHGAMIQERECVGKTWPGWWDTLRQSFEVEMEGIDLSMPFRPTSEAQEDTQRSIFLIGMRGAGKTTTGERVADLLKRPFLDLDALLESETERTIPEMINESGTRLSSTLLLDIKYKGLGYPLAAIVLGLATICAVIY